MAQVVINPGIKAHLANLIINNDCCLSIKSKKEPYLQCPHSKKVGDFCGVHNRTLNVSRIDNLIALINPDPINAPIIKEYQYSELQNIDKENLNPLRLHASLKKYQIDTTNLDKNDFENLVDKLKNHLKPLYYEALENSLGPVKVSDCQNQTDFFQFDELSDIPDHFFFSFIEAEATGIDSHKIHRGYGCDFRSFQQYIISLRKTQLEEANLANNNLNHQVQETALNLPDGETLPKWLATMTVMNPYNRQKLADRTLNDYHRKLIFLKKYHPQESIDFPSLELTPQQKLKFKVLDVFQIIYHYDYPVDHLWFLNLSKEQLLKYYSRLEDIWNFRLNLSLHNKKLIVPHNPNIFSKTEYQQLRHQNLFYIQNLMINHLESLVTQGQSLSDRKNGAMYLLIGLVEVCPQAAENLPYLAFSAGIGN